MVFLSGGELAESIRRLAARAKVQLKGIYLTGNRSPREVNAFAVGSGNVMITSGLVERMTRRDGKTTS